VKVQASATTSGPTTLAAVGPFTYTMSCTTTGPNTNTFVLLLVSGATSRDVTGMATNQVGTGTPTFTAIARVNDTGTVNTLSATQNSTGVSRTYTAPITVTWAGGAHDVAVTLTANATAGTCSLVGTITPAT